MYQKDNETKKELFIMFKTQNTFERIKLSRQLEDTFLSLYDPEKKLSPLNSLRTTRKIMNRMIRVMRGFIVDVRHNSVLSSIVPSYYEDDLKFIDALFKALRKTNIKLAFTPSRVPPKEYDNMDVLYYHGRDIVEEDPMIVENANDYIYAPTLESKDKDPLPSTSYRELQDRFTQKYNELYYPEGFTEEDTPKSFWEIIDSLHAGVNYARNCMEFYLKENRSEDDFTLCEYYAKVLDTYLRTKAELNLGILFVSDCDVRKPWSERNPMIVENADDYIYTPTLESKDKDPLPSTKEQTTRKPDEDMVDAISHGLRSFDLKYAKPFHPDEDLLIRITKLIFEWCETVGIDPSSAKYHILAELYSMMRRFVMLKTSEKKEEEN